MSETKFMGVNIQNSPLESTGGKVWPASRKFEELIGKMDFSSYGNELNILELGSGCGWLGLTLASKYSNWGVTLSEQLDFGALEWLRHNIALNPHINVDSLHLNWEDISDVVLDRKWDVILGCELVYSYKGAELLAALFSQFILRGAPVCYYAHTMNRFPPIDQYFLSQLGSKGLVCEVVYGSSPEKIEVLVDDLFPEMELVVFKITRGCL